MLRRGMRALPGAGVVALGLVSWLACGQDPPPSEGGTTTSGGSGPTTTAMPPGSSTEPPQGSSGSGIDPTPTTDDGDSTGSGIKLDVGGGQDGNDVELTGRVLAPNGEIPIAGALVYLTNQPPAGIPDGVYCHECQALGPQEFSTLTAPDGTFSLVATLDALDDAPAFLVVRKGEFLRVEPFTVEEGEHAVAEALTQLPGQSDPASGRWIPRIAVYDTWPDEVFNVLAKFGLGQVSAAGTLVPGTQQFTLLSDADQGAFMDDLAQMSQYHIIFLPCATTVF
ncbi:MAG: carboxypeptidase regulatory-like domain-containing protein, partial [Myxococcales bacterium]|nr:carboxypeptidase regulatory-like domain-containing protein [Myxococcales bacterium]